jgi:hypothetical protein
VESAVSLGSSTESANVTIPNTNNPDLSIWVTRFKAIASSYFTGINFKISSFKVDRYNFALITRFDL